MTALRVVLAVHGLITLAGGVVLAVFPTAIPALVGITVERGDYLLVYLVAAAEFAVAVLSFGAARLTDRTALGLVIATLVVLHGTSGVLILVYLALTQVNAALVVATVARFAAVAVLLTVWRLSSAHQTYGTSR
ncbi:hypothetical protein ABQF17_10000 [Mycolicibacterium elephantis]|uniref:hypothetical protein n=1 Tax=Mycolicibacterium elephantis TaxID=81858 RepID=UPI0007EA5FCA|nr:hypothetical protein [Mycolicibacterium elephantis]OBB24075.1 hypothetical protein A5762_13075 [Mycolicibacterium elephantis]OBF00574.1 hypothetical protein A5776_09890 [Mycolicibacterium elephantis]